MSDMTQVQQRFLIAAQPYGRARVKVKPNAWQAMLSFTPRTRPIGPKAGPFDRVIPCMCCSRMLENIESTHACVHHR